MAPPLIDTSIVPEVPDVLYALFDYGLTLNSVISALKDETIEAKDNTILATEDANKATESANEATATVDERVKSYDKYMEDLSFKEVYDGRKNYNKNNIVYHDGSSYIALQDVPKGNVPIIEGTEFWHLLARRGIDGDSSITNINGATPDEDGNVVVNTATDMKFTNTSMDIFAGRNIIYSDTEPDNPQDGDMWVDTSEW